MKIHDETLAVAFVAVADAWSQAVLERDLNACWPDDCITEDDPPYLPLRNRDALEEFSYFLEGSGWTTNQFVDGLIQAFTNNTTAEAQADEERRHIAGVAVWKLSEINLPAVTNFFKSYNDNASLRYKNTTIPGMFPYTNLEPEVLAYMRTLCVRTNVYDRIADEIMLDMFETLKTMPDELKPAATNRVAQYMYFAIHNVTDSQGWQDRELANFIPPYSNSVQRLALMSYVAASATNAWERSNAESIVQRLSALPTNQLNDVSWIAE